MSFNTSYVLGGDLDKVTQVGRLGSGRLDYPFFPTKTRMYTEGLLLNVPGMMGDFDIKYTPTRDVELTSVAVGANKYHPTDCWSLYVGDDVENNYICKTIYTKDVPEGIQFMAVLEVKAGQEVTFRFHNRGGQAKYVWVNYQGLRDPE